MLLHTVVSAHNAQPCFPSNPFSQIPLAMGFPPQPHSQSQKCSSLTCCGQDNPKASLTLISFFLGYFYLLSLSLFFFCPVNMHIYKHRLRTRGEVEKVTWRLGSWKGHTFPKLLTTTIKHSRFQRHLNY